MMTDTRDRILGYIHTHRQARPHDLAKVFGISHVALHKQLRALLEKGEISKVGKPPLVFYVPAVKRVGIKADVSKEIRDVIDANYLYISPRGELLYGLEGFAAWVKGIGEEVRLSHLASEYVRTLDQFKKYHHPKGWIDATEKLKNTFDSSAVDTLLYGDFYSLPKFGKTQLGQLVLYAKQSQNKELIGELAARVKPLIEKIMKTFLIDAISFIPPTVPRNLQFMGELERILHLRSPSLKLVKVIPGEVAVAQKTLGRLEERVTNARDTIFLKENEHAYKNVLLIDDAAGSGATFNETAKKLKEISIGKNKIVAFSIVGSFKGFDIIREV